MTNKSNEKQGCLTAILQIFNSKKQGKETLPYRVRDNFLSPAEISFYHVLASMIGSRAVICPKVRLADIFFVPRSSESYMSHYNRIAQRHLDFLLCKPDSMEPILGIEMSL